jgi:hypothetical protein
MATMARTSAELVSVANALSFKPHLGECLEIRLPVILDEFPKLGVL